MGDIEVGYSLGRNPVGPVCLYPQSGAGIRNTPDILHAHQQRISHRVISLVHNGGICVEYVRGIVERGSVVQDVECGCDVGEFIEIDRLVNRFSRLRRSVIRISNWRLIKLIDLAIDTHIGVFISVVIYQSKYQGSLRTDRQMRDVYGDRFGTRIVTGGAAQADPFAFGNIEERIPTGHDRRNQGIAVFVQQGRLKGVIDGVGIGSIEV